MAIAPLARDLVHPGLGFEQRALGPAAHLGVVLDPAEHRFSQAEMDDPVFGSFAYSIARDEVLRSEIAQALGITATSADELIQKAGTQAVVDTFRKSKANPEALIRLVQQGASGGSDPIGATASAGAGP